MPKLETNFHYFHELFSEYLRKWPEKIALQFESDKALKYKDLEEISNQWVRALQEHGVGIGDHVALCLPRSQLYPILFLALSKIGAVYIPINIDVSLKRNVDMLRDCNPKLILSTTNYIKQVSNLLAENMEARFIDINCFNEAVATQSTETVVIDNYIKSPEDLPLYIIYSSGTTGEPKGIPINHAGMEYWAAVLGEYIDSPARVLGNTALNFDPHIWEYLMAWSTGGSLHITNSETHASTDQLLTFLSKHKISDATFTPMTIPDLLEEPQFMDLQDFRRCYLTGADLTYTVLNKLEAIEITVFNCYGPTELTFGYSILPITLKDSHNNKSAIGIVANDAIQTFLHLIEINDDGERVYTENIVHLNHPILVDTTVTDCGTQSVLSGTEIGDTGEIACTQKVVNLLNSPPAEAMGELLVYSPYMTKGYLNNEEKSQLNFQTITIDNKGYTLYRTKDLMSIVHDKFYYQGRLSDMVKLNMHWVNLIEIARVVENFPDFEHQATAVALVRHRKDIVERDSIDYLYLFITRPSQGNVNQGQDGLANLHKSIQDYVQKELSVNEVPQRILFKDNFPQTTNGKIDQLALRTDMENDFNAIVGSQEGETIAIHQSIMNLLSQSPDEHLNQVSTMILEQLKSIFFETTRRTFTDDMKTHLMDTLMTSFQGTRFSSALKQQFNQRLEPNVLKDMSMVDIYHAVLRPYLILISSSHYKGYILEQSYPYRFESQVYPLLCLPPVTGISDSSYTAILKNIPDAVVFDIPTANQRLMNMHNETASLVMDSFADLSMPELAQSFATSVRYLQPEGPYYLMGWSFGGGMSVQVSYELLGKVALTIILDTPGPVVLRQMNPNVRFQQLQSLLNFVIKQFRDQGKDYHFLPESLMLDEEVMSSESDIKDFYHLALEKLLALRDDEYLKGYQYIVNIIKTISNNMAAVYSWVPPKHPLPNKLIVMQAQKGFTGEPLCLFEDWESQSRQLEFVPIENKSHFEIVTDETVALQVSNYYVEAIQSSQQLSSFHHKKIDGALLLKSLWNVPILNQHYQVRTVLSSRIKKALAESHLGVLSNQVLNGPGGIGKTQLALSHARDSEEYAFVRFISSETKQIKEHILVNNLQHNYRLFSDALGVAPYNAREGDEVIRQRVAQRLVGLLGARRGLIIFDNVENRTTLQPYLDSLEKTNVDVLITTRDNTWPGAIKVGVYTHEEAISYVCNTLSEQNELARLDDSIESLTPDDPIFWSSVLEKSAPEAYQIVTNFVARLENYPIVLTHALAYCKISEITLEDYLKEFEACFDEMIQESWLDEDILGDNYGKTIYVTFNLVFKALVKSESKMAIQSLLRVLGMLAYLASDDIPRRLIHGMVQGHMASETPSQQRKVNRQINIIIRQLRGYGILEQTAKNTYRVHRFLQTVIRFHCQLPSVKLSNMMLDSDELLEEIVMCFNRIFPLETMDELLFNTEQLVYLPHIASVLSYLPNNFISKVHLQSTLGYLHALNGAHREGLTQQALASETLLILPESSPALTEKIIIRRARALMALNQYLLAGELLKPKDFEIKEGSLARQNCYAELLCRMNNKEIAKTVIKKLLTRIESSEIVKPKMLYVQANLYVLLAELHLHFKEPELALTYMQQAMRYQSNNLLWLADFNYLLCKIHLALKNYTSAIECGDVSIHFVRQFYGEEHVQVGKYILECAYILMKVPFLYDKNGSKFYHKHSDLALQGRNLLTQLIEQGEKSAHYYLAQAYDRGVFIEYKKEPAKTIAITHFEKAAEAGNDSARYALALIYLMDSKNDVKGFVIREPRYERLMKAYLLLTEAAKTDFHAQYELGKMLLTGQGGAQTLNTYERRYEAMKHINAAADSGLCVAQYKLGEAILTESFPVAESQNRNNIARNCLTLAMEQGSHDARRLLLLMDLVGQENKLSLEALSKNFFPLTPLHFATNVNYIAGIKALVAAGIDSNIPHADNNATALHLAMRNGHITACQALMDLGANVLACDVHGSTVLHFAATEGFVSVIEFAIDAGAQVDKPAANGRRAIHVAAGYGQLSSFKTLVKKGADVKVCDNNGITVLHSAAQGGHPVIIERSIKLGVDVNQPDNNGQRAIHNAAWYGRLSAFNTLEQCGADVLVCDYLKRTVLHFAALGGDSHITQLVIEKAKKNENFIKQQDERGRCALFYAAQKGHLSVVKTLLHYKADVTVCDEDGSTVLHAAAQGGSPGIIDLLIKAKVDVNQLDKKGRGAIHVAAISGQVLSYKALLCHGAAVPVCESFGVAMLLNAACGGNCYIIDMLLNQPGVAVNQPDNGGRRAIHVALQYARLSAYELLIFYKADVHVCDKSGRSALHYAARGGDPKMIELVIQSGVDINQAAADGCRAIHIVAENTQLIEGGPRLAQLMAFKILLRAGADLSVCDEAGQTVLHYAAKGGHPGIIDLVLQESVGLLDKADKDGHRAIHIAAHGSQSTSYKTFAKLLDHGVDVSVRNTAGFTVLHYAAKGGNPSIIELALKAEGGLKVNHASTDGQSALQIAAQYAQLSAFEALLHFGANYTQTDNFGRSTLDYAKLGKHPAIIARSIELENKYCIQAIKEKNYSVAIVKFKKLLSDLKNVSLPYPQQLRLSCQILDKLAAAHRESKNYTQAIGFFKKASLIQKQLTGENSNEFINFGQKLENCVDQLKLSQLLAKYKLFDSTQSCLEIALRNAAVNGQVNDLKYFKTKVNNINAQDSNPEKLRTALHWAVIRGRTACVEFLISVGAAVNIPDAMGKTAIDYAHENSDSDIIALFNMSSSPEC